MNEPLTIESLAALLEKGDAAIGAPTLSFGQALDALHQGEKVARTGWNGKGMWLALIPGSTITVTESDMLARDWCIVI